MGLRCPGQDTRFWKPQDIFNVDCPHCGRKVEFFKDDVTRKCPGCGNRIVNPRYDPGCAKWCPYAEVCLGEAARSSRDPKIVRERIEFKVRQLLKDRPETLNRALRTAQAAEKLISEEGADALPVLAASLLLDVGTAGKPDNGRSESADIARDLLTDICLDSNVIEEVAKLIEDRDSGDPADISAKLLHDAREFVEFEDAVKSLNDTGAEGKTETARSREKLIERFLPNLKTEAGRKLIRHWPDVG